MKVLVATCLGQGRKQHDVCDTLEGELVVLLQKETDCWVCRRSLIGLVSGRDTTTFMVADRPEIDRSMYRQFVRDGLARVARVPDDSDDVWLDPLVDEMLATAEYFETGSILERLDTEISVRCAPGSSRNFAA
jgi:hypothetical protein